MQSVEPPILLFVSHFTITLICTVWYYILPGISASPTISTVTTLNNVTLTCSVTTPLTSTHLVSYSWYRVGDIFFSHANQNTNRLTLHRVVPADGGQYYCMATWFWHCARSENVMVIVKNGK